MVMVMVFNRVIREWCSGSFCTVPRHGWDDEVGNGNPSFLERTSVRVNPNTTVMQGLTEVPKKEKSRFFTFLQL